MIIANKNFDENRTYIMGILNVTPDSFSDGGKHFDIDTALFDAKKMYEEGCDVFDVGGESTRPGYTVISDAEEIERVCPVIERLSKEFDIPISIDTYKSAVAKAAINSGALIVNDIWGLKYDEKMAPLIADCNVHAVLMHNRNDIVSANLKDAMLKDLDITLGIARDAGIQKDKIILDPGIGFGKSYEQNLEVLGDIQSYVTKGYPILLGSSRKSVIGLSLDLDTNNREEGTIVTTVMGVMANCMFIRVHDVLKNKRAVKMAEAIKFGQKM